MMVSSSRPPGTLSRSTRIWGASQRAEVPSAAASNRSNQNCRKPTYPDSNPPEACGSVRTAGLLYNHLNMADLKHLQVLSAGRSIWNEWRQENSGVTPDLDAANLHGLTLRGTNLV